MNVRVIDLIVIEDDGPTREALCNAVAGDERLRLVGQAGDHAEASTLVENAACTVALVDLDLAGIPSFDLIERLAQCGRTRILVISALGDEASVIAAIEAGADGYLLKEGAIADLHTPIRQLLDGQAPISPGVARHLLRRIRPDSAPTDSGSGMHLTPREQQVLQLFALGASYKEVANRCDISLHTVRDHVKALYRKLQVHSRGVAVRRAAESGLIKMPAP
ncbi:MAG: response regulator transcription factor [Rhodanobacteraceae bacterium]|nr:response regulator transcription factor [Rhodanobacteraceae bacterium]